MALLNPSFIFGVLVVLYLSSFVLFAIVRFLTGLSIQRIGYFSLRRLAYVPKDGIKIEIRGLGLNVHRPTFAQPTWLSVVVSELVVTVDVRELEASKASATVVAADPDDPALYKKDQEPKPQLDVPRTPITRRHTNTYQKRSETWKQLTRIKERIKKLHGNVNWLRMVDVVATNSTVNIVDVGNIQFGSVTIAVDTRRKMVDRARFFWASRSRTSHGQRQAEWIMTIRSVLFTPLGAESAEVLDNLTLNVHGFLYENLDGLREASIALKLGRVHVPLDDIITSTKRMQELKSKAISTPPPEPMEEYVEKVMQELDEPGSTDEQLMQTVSDSREFVGSILRGIKEVQFAVSFVGLTKKVEAVKTAGPPVILNASMKEVGIDLHRLDPKSPAHRMYFPSKDLAHEALLAALSISIGLDDGNGSPQRLVYVPMATTTVRTTLPSKTVEISGSSDPAQRNANILFANSVVTSPSVDLDPKHLPILLAMLRPKPKRRRPQAPMERHTLISRLLPKANIKFSMHEPVLRIALPPVGKGADPDDFDLIISSISSISIDAESFHSTIEELHYSLASNLRVQSHNLYYQTFAGERFDLVETESFDLKVNLSASPDVQVLATGNLQTFAVRLVRPEITDGLRQIVRQLRLRVEPDKRGYSKSSKESNFLRGMPPWLLHFKLQASDFSAEIAGVDEDISAESRGVSLSLEEWTVEYRAQRLEGLPRRGARKRANSRVSVSIDPEIIKSLPVSPKKKHSTPGDGRRVAFHVRGLEAFVVESADRWEIDPFIRMPRFEVAFSTTTDKQGPVFHVHSHIKTLMVQYSLYRHYAIGVAVSVLRKAFVHGSGDAASPSVPSTPSKPKHKSSGSQYLSPPLPDAPLMEPEEVDPATELVAIDFKAVFVQIKADMPADPPLMLHVHGLEAGRHRWSSPFFHTRLIRLYSQPPRMHGVWAKILSIKHGRLDYRESRRKLPNGVYQEEKMFDIVTEAVRGAIPHEFVLSKVSDNVTNVIKSVQQLHHRFKTGTNEYILDKGPEGPKNVPKVSFRTKALLFELEDGAFEWKLGMIYRAGRIEQMQRQAREEAFRIKVKKIHEEARKETSVRARSTGPRAYSTRSGAAWDRSDSADGRRPRSSSVGRGRGRPPRYDPDVGCEITGHTLVSIADARAKLNAHNSKSWRYRIDRFYAMARNGIKDVRSTFWGAEQIPDDFDDGEDILEVPHRSALMSALIHDLHFMIDKPSFPMEELPDFLHKVGKGMPRDMKYSLLVPMNIQVNMGEARISLRDYPLPLLHVPSLSSTQSSRLPALSLKTNFVIAEEFRGIEATRRIRVNVIPTPGPGSEGGSNRGFDIDVRRTIGPIKSYSDMHVDINTSLPTRITWGPSYQPAIQDMMMVIESFTKPQLDPSERVGFWDKIRLGFHSRVRIAWKGDGDVHFCLKGTRDPYQVIGNGAGFLMCWRNDVRWNIHTEDDPKQFMTVDSGEYVLAIPDFSQYARDTARRQNDSDSVLSETSTKTGAAFKKVVMKLSGKVQVMAGLVFEQAIENGKRRFDFRPHYEVKLKSPSHAKPDENGLPYDAFRGFRSQHIHLSIAVRAPVDRDWVSSSVESSRSYNTVHLTPRFFTHFFAWWSLFGGTMSLPVRQGNLWPGREKNSKKFGRHLATIKYNILLAPLFLSHIYKHKDVEDCDENAVSATGVKVRFDSFKLDIHQRREEFNTTSDKGLKAQSRTTGMKIHAAQLDLAAVDIRAVSASIKGTTTEAIMRNSLGSLITQHEDDGTDLSKFTIPDNDLSWIDMDDFVELDWILPSEANPDTKILPLAFCPRLTYFRQTDIGGIIAGDPERTSPFGHEPTHLCSMSQDDDPRRVQAQLVQQRLDQLALQLQENMRSIGNAELKLIREGDQSPEARATLDALLMHGSVLHDKKEFLESMLDQMTSSPIRANDSETSSGQGEGSINLPTGADFASDFLNRFVVHNLQLKWNNLLRNIILRYIHQVSQRRGFIYYLSRPAVKFILDIVEEQTKLKSTKKSDDSTRHADKTKTNGSRGVKDDIQDRIEKILQDGRKFVSADDDTESAADVPNVSMQDLTGGIAEGFMPQKSYHVRLIAPQIQLQSDKNKNNVVMITSKGMELKVVEVSDKERIFDSVSGLVQRRFLVNMDSTQFFVTHQKWFSTQLLSLYSGSTYGTPNGSSWPPWVPMEIMSDFKTDPVGFKRVVQKTSAMLRYDKYNTLRLKYNDDVNSGDGADGESDDANAECRMDNLIVEFPQARAICNSSQYYAIYVIVLDLLMYSEPLEKTRSERLEKIMLASDFSDLRGTPEMVIKLQERIRQLEDIKSHFQIHSKYLDKQGWQDRLLVERDLAACEDELFFMMKAITTSQRKYDSTQGNALLKWCISVKDIVWHLVRDGNEPLCEFQLKDVEYDRTDNSDGSHINLIRVGKVLGLNLLRDALYPEMVAPFLEGDRSATILESQPMVTVYWYMLEAVAGIPVMDHFEVNLFPLKVQLEREVGKKLFEYVFPGMEGDKFAASGGKNDSPLMPRTDLPGGERAAEEEFLQDQARPATARSDMDGLDATPFETRAGSLELRLRPTLTSDDKVSSPKNNKASSVHSNEKVSGFGGFFRSNRTGLAKKKSLDSLRSANPRPGVNRSGTSFSTKNETSSVSSDTTKKSRFTLRRSDNKPEEPSDDLTEMISRASNYMTFSHIKLPSVVLCLSYKGKGDRNIEDVHDFVFRLPTIEYHNKMWSNLDLALALKSRVIKALISHTGAIIGNKFRHRPNIAQQNKLRELASSSVIIAPASLSDSQHGGSGDDSSSLFGLDFSRSPPRSIQGSGSSIPLPRSNSRSSSVTSSSKSMHSSHLQVNTNTTITASSSGASSSTSINNSSNTTNTNTNNSGPSGPVVPSFQMMPPTPKERTPSESSSNKYSGFGISMLRPSSSSSMRSFNSSSFGANQRRGSNLSMANSTGSGSPEQVMTRSRTILGGFNNKDKPEGNSSGGSDTGNGNGNAKDPSNFFKEKFSALANKLNNNNHNQHNKDSTSNNNNNNAISRSGNAGEAETTFTSGSPGGGSSGLPTLRPTSAVTSSSSSLSFGGADRRPASRWSSRSADVIEEDDDEDLGTPRIGGGPGGGLGERDAVRVNQGDLNNNSGDGEGGGTLGRGIKLRT
ncbi:mitochondrial protein from FMP27-domain-containing protein [Coniella lustricola]|uniref:Mitochondrial protein from FMP27-domain-containing protein n=1 Tax=Coniella lustricola TaxID=2025994 RepID=A0A2T2ZWJ2_9PEZI|nr:mitochondrial protein from FMP27-domain-containing protein [Coniella lustricola]